ncbi:hypothetical protein GOODEAATRI_005537 [Goodea atripinnis]|uniref:Uncharacterized protein n=1 Tax=Goodea atripinnis TaxID=208336 RepID=A0ABV0PBR3_9TELE
MSLDSNSLVLVLSPKCQTMFLVSCQSQPSIPSKEDFIGVHSLCLPALRESSLHRISESGGRQALIDQWGHSSLNELEAFIDSYFEMVWEQTMGSSQPSESDPPTTAQDAVVSDAGEEQLLSSIDRKLSRLELLEEIWKDLAELKQNMEFSLGTLQELRDKCEKHFD